MNVVNNSTPNLRNLEDVVAGTGLVYTAQLFIMTDRSYENGGINYYLITSVETGVILELPADTQVTILPDSVVYAIAP